MPRSLNFVLTARFGPPVLNRLFWTAHLLVQFRQAARYLEVPRGTSNHESCGSDPLSTLLMVQPEFLDGHSSIVQNDEKIIACENINCVCALMSNDSPLYLHD